MERWGIKAGEEEEGARSLKVKNLGSRRPLAVPLRGVSPPTAQTVPLFWGEETSRGTVRTYENLRPGQPAGILNFFFMIESVDSWQLQLPVCMGKMDLKAF